MDPYYADDAVTIYHGDAREFSCVGPSADLSIVDLPYNAGMDYGPGVNDRMADEEYHEFVDEVLGSLHTDNLAWTPGTRNIEHAWEWARAVGWDPQRLLAWHKKEYAGDKWTNGPAMCWEPVMWASRHHHDKPFYNRIFGAWGRDFLVVPSTHGHGIAHPCPKPPEVYRWLIGLFCPEGGSVIDPTCGSGTSLMVAKDTGRKAIGIEINEAFCEIAAKRCAQEVLDFGGVA